MDFNFNFSDLQGSSTSILSSTTPYDLLVIGGGPAGLNGALYAKRKGLSTGIIATSLGGQVSDTSSVENYLGYPSIPGEGLVNEFVSHVQGLDIPILKEHSVTAIKAVPNSSLKEVVLSNGDSYQAKALIIATGSKARRLGIPGEVAYTGRGVAYCAICDGPFFTDREVVVAGGGNSAVEAAIDLAKIAKKVTLIHRSELRADNILIAQLERLPNVEVLLQSQLLEVIGNDLMTGVRLLNKGLNQEVLFPTDGLFVEIGSIPNSETFKGILTLNGKGEIVVDSHGRTNMDGIFAAGDVTNTPYKQIIMAAADGAKCALAANDYLNSLKA